ncbi:ANTAR domain-containing protein [Streptomyces sp. NRRL S-340]|uniref:ANTAR domain-containing protein n=1 Tax=Streptomyces sp. NRRL S-340 TaxID=1463901 RepID=UPI00068F49DD|nr:ANTAR domain-containing protein [Streptomyces sp. NRRL S-340]
MTSAAPAPLARRLSALARTLTIGVRTDPDGRASLTPRGELVHGCAGVLTTALARLPARTGRVDLDMAAVTFMDSAGLEFLDVLDAYGRTAPARVTATGWTGQPRRVLELAGLDTTDPLSRTLPPPRGPEPCAQAPATDAPAADPPLARAARMPAPVPSAVADERTERLLELEQEVRQLRRALVSRPVIDQARGILMAAHACTAQQAWDILREASQRSNTKLRTVAAAVTAGARPDGPAPPEEIRAALRSAVVRTTGTGPAGPVTR